MADAVPGTRIQPAGRPLDGLPKAAPQGRAERERASSTADPQCVLILDDASTVAAPEFVSEVEFRKKSIFWSRRVEHCVP